MSHSSEDVASPLSAQVESRPGLLRVLGPGMAIAIVVGNVIGSGIFAKPGRIAADAGDFRLILAAWVTGGILCILGALCFAELAVMLPRAGGLYVYLREAYGRLPAFLFGWSEFLFGRPASIGALSIIFVGSLFKYAGWHPGMPVEIVLAILLISLMCWVNVIGVIWGGRMQGATTVVKAGFVAFVAILPFAMLLFGEPGVDSQNYSSVVSTETSGFAGRFAIVLLSVMWAYNGWHGVTPVAEEIRNPQRNIPRALFGGIGLLILLYISANVAYHGVLTMEEMKAAGDHAAEDMVKALLGPVGEKIMSFGVMVSTLGAINSNLLLGPRVSFAMGRDDVFLRPLGRVHVNFRTPAAAILLQSVMGVVLVIASAILVRFMPGFQDKNIFGLLTDYIIFSASIFYMMAVLGVIVLRIKHPDWERPYRTLGYPFVPIAYLSFYCFFLYYVYQEKPFEAQVGIGLIALGVPVYFIYRAWARKHPEQLHDGM